MAAYVRSGRWCNIRKRFLEENHPEELERMQADGTLKEYLNIIEDEYNERFARMEDDRLRKSKLETRYSKREIDWQTYVGEFNQIRTQIAELLTEELCCPVAHRDLNQELSEQIKEEAQENVQMRSMGFVNSAEPVPFGLINRGKKFDEMIEEATL